MSQLRTSMIFKGKNCDAQQFGKLEQKIDNSKWELETAEYKNHLPLPQLALENAAAPAQSFTPLPVQSEATTSTQWENLNEMVAPVWRRSVQAMLSICRIPDN